MNEELRTVPFECQRCWYVWEEDYVVRHQEDQHGNAAEIWLQNGLPVPPPSAAAVCPKCGCQKAKVFPDGYLTRHPELIKQAEPAPPDETPLISPVRRPLY
ncbi:hypothetical protein [Nonomuraea sp. NPDC049309]|uniref:hypothetical protein n=1 Tax=Nonomuraea sp. NPDC049309 TaxID=3364350 RepID=UPI0037186FFC